MGTAYQKADSTAAKQVDAKFSDLAVSSAKQQQQKVLVTIDISLQDLSIIGSLSKSEQSDWFKKKQEGVSINKLR